MRAGSYIASRVAEELLQEVVPPNYAPGLVLETRHFALMLGEDAFGSVDVVSKLANFSSRQEAATSSPKAATHVHEIVADAFGRGGLFRRRPSLCISKWAWRNSN